MDGEKDKGDEDWREREAQRLEHEARDMEDEAHRLEKEAHRLEDEAHRLEDEAHHDHGGDNGHHIRPGVVAMTVVILNGPSPVIEAREDELLLKVVVQALAESENVGQKPEDWQLKTLDGNGFDLDRTVGSYDFECEVTVYLSPKAGVAGEMGVLGDGVVAPDVTMPPDAMTSNGIGVVDPEISRRKFTDEVALLKSRAADNLARGILLLDAVFPKVFVAFAATRLKPAPILGAVEIDFSDYDFRPPSVRFVDPFSRRILTASEMTMCMLRRQAVDSFPVEGAGQVQMTVQNLIQAHATNGIPFLCLPGVREYHDDPGHSGDSWFLHRKGGQGTLAFILEAIWTYGSNPIEAYQIGVQAPAIMVVANQASIPA